MYKIIHHLFLFVFKFNVAQFSSQSFIYSFILTFQTINQLELQRCIYDICKCISKVRVNDFISPNEYSHNVIFVLQCLRGVRFEIITINIPEQEA